MSGLLSPAASALAEDPAEGMYAWFRTVRAREPVHCDEHGLWHVFSHADVSRVLSDPVTFSSDDRAFVPRQQDVDLFARGNIANLDPPRHRQLRSLVNRAFTPRAVAGLAPWVEEITRSLLDRVQGADGFDLVDALAYPLPVTVICGLLGVPPEDLPTFRRWAEALFGVQVDASTLPSEELVAEMAPVLREMNTYLLDRIRLRREQPPGDDLLGRLAGASLDGAAPAEEEAVGFAGVLLLAGHVTTTALLGNVVLCLARHPEAAAQVRAAPALLPGAIEEVLRYRSPFPRLGRVTTRPVRLGGRTVPAGSLVLPWVGAANRDPDRFTDPERFDIHRDAGAHLAFGHGIHFCIGAPLARLETRVALTLLLRRHPRLAVDGGGIEYHNPWAIVAARRLPVRVAG